MPNLPVRLTDTGRPSRALTRAVRETKETELAIYRHHLDARYLAECDRIDSQALGDVVRSALDEEMNVLDTCLVRAGDSPAKKELVARLVALQSELDSRRIARRYGG
jgi:hypothetical protein